MRRGGRGKDRERQRWDNEGKERETEGTAWPMLGNAAEYDVPGNNTPSQCFNRGIISTSGIHVHAIRAQ